MIKKILLALLLSASAQANAEIKLLPYYAVGYDFGGGVNVYLPDVLVDNYAHIGATVAFNYDGTYTILPTSGQPNITHKGLASQFVSSLNTLWIPFMAFNGHFYSARVWVLPHQRYDAALTEINCNAAPKPYVCSISGVL